MRRVVIGRTVVALMWGWRVTGAEHRGASGVLAMVGPLTWLTVKTGDMY